MVIMVVVVVAVAVRAPLFEDLRWQNGRRAVL